MTVICYECKWDCLQGWCYEGESPDEWAWGGCGPDAIKGHQGGPHKWIQKVKWHVDEAPAPK